MGSFMTFDNVKKLAKVTKLSKRMIRFADGLGYDVGIKDHELCIAFDAEDIMKPHVDIRRRGDSYRIFMVNYNSDDYYVFKHFENQSDAFMYALMWLSEIRRE